MPGIRVEKLTAVDGDLALHAPGDLGEEIDLEALDAAAELRHGVRRERAVDPVRSGGCLD
jgi:hypothetical protein